MKAPKTKKGRMCGNTTRLVDYYIQELFTNGHIIVSDHYISDDVNVMTRSSKMLMDKIKIRLRIEHDLEQFSSFGIYQTVFSVYKVLELRFDKDFLALIKSKKKLK